MRAPAETAAGSADEMNGAVCRAEGLQAVKGRLLEISSVAILGIAVIIGATGVAVGYGVGRGMSAAKKWEKDRAIKDRAEEKRWAEMQAWQAENPEIVKELWSLGIPKLREREEEVEKIAEDNQNLAATLQVIRVAKERISPEETVPAGGNR